MKDEETPILEVIASGTVSPEPSVAALLGDVRTLIEDARLRTAVAVNREMTLLYWHIGNRIRRDVLGEDRAEYGSRILQTLSANRGFSHTNLLYMMQFAEVFHDMQIVQSLIGQ